MEITPTVWKKIRPENLIEFKKLRAKFRRTIKESKEKQGNFDNKSNSWIQFLKLDKDKVAMKPKDMANILAEKFKLNSSDRNYSTTFLLNTSDCENQARDLLNQDGEDELIMST